jgi:hypothetical protein
MGGTTMSDDGKDSQIINYLVRMVVPLRREFGRSLDVGQFLHDVTYAREVIEQALSSQDPRLRDYANYVHQRLHGPRVADSTAAPPPVPQAAAKVGQVAAPSAASAAQKTEADKTAAEEAELKARMLRKYTGGLR